MEKAVYVIILNYNGYEDTIKCIQSVKKSTYQKLRIIVIDNGSKDFSENRIKEVFPDIYIIQTGKNAGFAGGNNIGIRYALQEGADYICLLNNDVLVAEDMISILVKVLKENERRIVGPATMIWREEIIHSTGLKINFSKGTARLINLKENYERVEKCPIYCDYLEGTCLMFAPNLIQEVGLIPEEYFLYYEETEWCCKAKKRRYDIVCIPQAKLWHKGSASVNKITGLKLYFEDRNRVLFERRNAPLIKRLLFYLYFFIQLIYRILSHQRDVRAFRAVLDGYRGKIDWTFYDDNSK